MSLFAFLCGIVRVRVRPDCHQNSHQSIPAKHGYREGTNRQLLWNCPLKASALDRVGIRIPSRTISVGVMAARLTLVDQLVQVRILVWQLIQNFFVYRKNVARLLLSYRATVLLLPAYALAHSLARVLG